MTGWIHLQKSKCLQQCSKYTDLPTTHAWTTRPSIYAGYSLVVYGPDVKQTCESQTSALWICFLHARSQDQSTGHSTQRSFCIYLTLAIRANSITLCQMRWSLDRFLRSSSPLIQSLLGLVQTESRWLYGALHHYAAYASCRDPVYSAVSYNSRVLILWS